MNYFFVSRLIGKSVHARIIAALAMFFLIALIVFFSSNARGAVWESVGPGGGGWLTDIDYSSKRNELFTALDCGGVRISRNYGASWEIPGKGFDSWFGTEIEDVAVSPINPKLVLLAAWTGIYRSQDAGKTWKKVHSTGLGDVRVNVIGFDPDNANIMYAGTGSTKLSLGFMNYEGNTDSQGIMWRSTDGGKTWSEIQKFDQRMTIYSIIVDGRKTKNANDNRLLLSTNKGIRRSGDGGESFVTLSQGIPENARQAAQSFVSRGRVWAVIMNDGVYRTENFGDTWARIGLPTKHAYQYLTVDPATKGAYIDTVLVGYHDYHNIGGVFEGNGRENFPQWREVFPSKSIEYAWDTHEGIVAGDVAVGYPKGKRTIYVIVPGARLYASSDNGASWKPMQSQKAGAYTWKGNGFELMILADGAIDPRNGELYFSYIDFGTFKSSDGGYSWKQLEAGGWFAGWNPEAVGVNPLSGDVYVSVADGKILRSANGGEDFQEDFGSLALQFAFDGSGGAYAATGSGVVKRAGVGQWEKIGDLAGANSVAVSHNVLYAANAEGVWKFEGGKWMGILNTANIKAGGVVIHPTVDEMLVLTDRGIMLQDGTGQIKEVLAGEQFEALKSAGSTVYAKSRVNGIWRSVDFGTSWTNVTGEAYQDGYERGLVIDPADPATVYYGTKCMGVFRRKF